MKFFDYLKIISHSFYSSNLYKYIYNSWNGNIFAYYFILSFIISLPISAEKLYIFSQIEPEKIASGQEQAGLNKNLHYLWQQFPTIIIQGGQMKTKDGGKNVINNSQGVAMILFDPEQKLIGTLPVDTNPELVNFGKYGIFFRSISQGGGNFIEYKDLPFFSEQDSVMIDQSSILTILIALKKNSLMLSFVYAFAAAWMILVSSALYAVFYMLVIRLFLVSQKAQVNNKNLLILIMVSQTPALIAKALASTDLIYFYFTPIIYLPTILGMSYLVYALKSIKIAKIEI